MEPVAGAILAGGASRRMGRTKALIDVDGVPMAQCVARALAAGGCKDIALVGGSPLELAALELPVVADGVPGEGPLGGIISALGHFTEVSHVLVAACDLPLIDAGTVRNLLHAAQANPGRAATAAQTDRVEPALVVWSRACLDELVALFDGGERAVHRVLDQIDTQTVQVASRAMTNVNRPPDVPGSSDAGQ
ncbi:molybdenum cofactor guanylyltransferase [Ilumatobacter sp.]|uniref:molybdenum cofactor guanylyltransferase n=1 Tax=Ilumatobacter sp. TaxID=1967498 RepID=UPI003F6AFBE3